MMSGIDIAAARTSRLCFFIALHRAKHCRADILYELDMIIHLFRSSPRLHVSPGLKVTWGHIEDGAWRDDRAIDFCVPVHPVLYPDATT